jgi:protein-ribulosamine 3-kinase
MVPRDIIDYLERFYAGKDQVPFRVFASAALSGGSINHVFRIRTSHGDLCLKYNHAGSFPRMFESEAFGLSLLAQAGEIRVPEPVCFETLDFHTFLLLEYIEAAKPRSDMMHHFGRSLASLHRHHGNSFGLDSDNYMGALPQRNNFHGKWTNFFIHERLIPQVKLAADRGLAGNATIRQFESLYLRLDDFFPAELPSLLHGDLWNGNYIVSEQGTAALIDPAVYYGHREVDIAMTTLFGGFSAEFYEGYNEVFPLEKGWRERLGMYNLYPLLIHLNLFGTSYLGEVESILKRY